MEMMCRRRKVIITGTDVVDEVSDFFLKPSSSHFNHLLYLETNPPLPCGLQDPSFEKVHYKASSLKNEDDTPPLIDDFVPSTI